MFRSCKTLRQLIQFHAHLLVTNLSKSAVSNSALSSAVSACGNVVQFKLCEDTIHLEKGKWLHHKLIMCGVEKDLYIETALTDMYAKSGDLQTAEGVFRSMSEKSVVSWSTMISGHEMHGCIDAAITIFNQMVELGIKPNHITFMNFPSACCHSGSVEQGKFYCDLMKDFGIEPDSEHFACTVDLWSHPGDIGGA
ncbi:hypothetical protein NC653_025660 [Populus alba x Populus x berolinensis]|uniref:Pentatricopeptide repeat-containing protein n=2 Tax=Populus alba x Populus x berolinensis TaxID=444605 RepID=A0AAD6Q9A9_9ROSI|nr:hypothetical protein NC653_025660 [Populus alba x Populus x berolinensis]